MAVRQKYTPNLGVAAVRGWCLKYIDDAGKAPNRRPSAQAAFNYEKSSKHVSTKPAPIDRWVVGFLQFTSGPYVSLGHVFFMKNKGAGKYDIRDSEVRAGARKAYTNIDQVVAWFGAYNPRYVGWSMYCDGRQYAETYTPKPSSTPKRKSKKGVATVLVSELNVRNSSSTKASIVARYKKGQKFTYDSYIDINGYRWLSYISYSGTRRYVAQGKGSTKYVKGGV